MEAPRSQNRINAPIAPVEVIGKTEIQVALTPIPWALGEDALVLRRMQAGGLADGWRRLDVGNLSASSPNPIVQMLAAVCEEIRTHPRDMQAALVLLRDTIARYAFTGDVPIIHEPVVNKG